MKEGDTIKFVNRVYKILFNGGIALKDGKKVMYITERAVFSLSKNGLILEELAPGIDLDRDVLDKMEFKPVISKEMRYMDSRIFRNRSMRLRAQIDKDLKKRMKDGVRS